MPKRLRNLTKHRERFIESKQEILQSWVSFDEARGILELHEIDCKIFVSDYASGVFDYFMGVIAGETQIGDCPIMQKLLTYFKDREISADELFEICSYFRQSMINFTYDANINSKEIFDEISYIFDKNFRGILKFYTDTIFNKLIDARAEALKAGRAKDLFLSNMSHEIRTPLNAILGFVNLIKEDTLSKQHQNYLDIISNSGENLLSIINDILDFSKLRSGEFMIEPKVFSLHEEISHTMELFVASASSKNITITSFIDPNIPKELYADALRLKQVLSNLLSNAIKFTPYDGIISVEATCQDKRLCICVSDSGIGISEEDIKTIFSAFAQAESDTMNKSSGTGLGLSISQQLAHHMGGKIYVESTLGKGSKFYLEIPVEVHTLACKIFDDIATFQKLRIAIFAPEKKLSLHHEWFLKYSNVFDMDVSIVDTLEGEFDIILFHYEVMSKEQLELIYSSSKKFVALMSKLHTNFEESEHIQPMCFPLYCSKIQGVFSELLLPHAKMPKQVQTSKHYQGHLLVAEDNEANQALISILLDKYGLSFDLAINGLEAYQLFKENKYDLILMDEQMPIMDGNESVAKILAHEKANALEHTPISALTANVIKGAKERGLSSGFDSFLGKPIILKELERVFSQYLEDIDAKEQIDKSNSNGSKRIQGLDANKLTKELMLNEDELIMLLEMFINKMNKLLPELKSSIEAGDFKKVGLTAHSIKGSSGNFRIEELQREAALMEEMAKEEDKGFDFNASYEAIERSIKSIEIV